MPVRSVISASRRTGFALPSAIIVLVLLSALVVGALFMATEELRAGRSDVADQRALAVAERALQRAVVGWDTQRNTALGVGQSAPIAERAPLGGDRVDVVATRVQRRSFWISARAMAGGDGRAIPARHTVAASLRLVGPTIASRAALTAAGTVTVVDGGIVDGRDAAPPGWEARLCADEAPADAAAVMVTDITRVCGVACTGEMPPGVTGAPPIEVAPGLGVDSTFTAFGDETRAGLARRAGIVVAGGTLRARPSASATGCDRADVWNWGDPSSGTAPCADHFPIVWIRGSALLAAGSVGQGMLIVDGDLQLEAGARFVGVVVAGGDIVVAGAGAEIIGAALAAGVDGSSGSRVADGGAVRRSGCAVRRAALGVSRLTRTPVRWWAELR